MLALGLQCVLRALFLSEPALNHKSGRSKVYETMANDISGLLSHEKEMGNEGLGTFWFSLKIMPWQGSIISGRLKRPIGQIGKSRKGLF